MSSAAQPPARVATILLYASDRLTRENVRLALGRRVARDVPEVRVVEVATQAAVVSAVDGGGIDAVVLDGEAWPTGGMGLAKQMKDELPDCPPVLVLVARRDDRWLATWSQADAVVSHPIDPPELTAALVELLRRREAGLPVRRAVH